MRVQLSKSIDFNQMLVFSVFGHLLILTFVLFFPKSPLADKAVIPAFMVSLVESPSGNKNAVKKKDARPFKVADDILMRVIDPLTGEKALSESKSTIIEAYKNIETGSTLNNDINNRLKNDNILRFY